MSGIKSMYIDSSVCVKVKRGESERFTMDSVVRQGCIMPHCLFNVYMDAMMKEVKMGMGKRGVRLASCMQMTWFCVVNRMRT